MQIYWYWPFVRPEELVLADSVPGPGDSIVVHAVKGRLAGVVAGDHRSEIVDELPGLPPRSEGSLAWLGSRTTAYTRRAAERRRYLARRPFDVAHVVYLNYFTDWWALRSLSKKLPLVCDVHDVVPHQSRVPRGIERRLLAAQYRAAGTIVVHHETVRTRLLAEFDVAPERVEVVPWPVLPAPLPRRVRSDGPPVVLFFGTLRRNKGVDVLLDAITRLRDLEDVRFVIAGRGFADVERTVRGASEVDGRIGAEIGYVTEERKHALFGGADLVILPYTSFASQSAVLNDAYAHHAPVVVTDVGALGTSVREERTGWVVPAGDSGMLADAIARALSDPAARKDAGNRQAALAAQRSPEMVGATLRALYQRLIG